MPPKFSLDRPTRRRGRPLPAYEITFYVFSAPSPWAFLSSGNTYGPQECLLSLVVFSVYSFFLLPMPSVVFSPPQTGRVFRIPYFFTLEHLHPLPLDTAIFLPTASLIFGMIAEFLFFVVNPHKKVKCYFHSAPLETHLDRPVCFFSPERATFSPGGSWTRLSFFPPPQPPTPVHI